MQIYFDKVQPNDQEPEDFKHGGENFYYAVEAGVDYFLIKDTCGRFVPFSLESIRPLIDALVILDHNAGKVVSAIPAMQMLNSDEVRTV